MRIDLHCHTKATKTGDSEKRNIDAINFKNKVNSADVKIVGIANHNVFDKYQYEEFLSEVNNDFMIWPGIELDVEGLARERGHVVIISNPSNVELFKEKVDEMIGTTTPDIFKCSLDDLIEFVNSIDCIVMPHYYKPKSLKEESIMYIKENMTEKYKFLYEPSNFRSLGILINHKRNSIIGSDVKDWDEYYKNEFANLKIDVDSYEQFMFLVKKDVSLIETLLNNQYKTKIDISYNKDSKEEVEFYDDVNVIFGSKGTGKSETLKKVKEYYKDKGKSIGFYEPKNTQDKIDEKLNILDEERKLSTYEKNNLENDFITIINWNDENITQFKDYINYVSSKNKNINKEKMKLLEITTISNEYTKEYNEEIEDLKNIQLSKNTLDNISLDKYIEEEEIVRLKNIINKAIKNVTIKKNNSWKSKTAVDLSNFTVEEYKNIVERNTELKTKPNDTGFLNFAKNRLELKSSLNRIVNAFSYEFEDEVISIGKLEEGKELEQRTIKRMLNDECKTKEFTSGIQMLREVKRNIFNCHENVLKLDVLNILDELATLLNENKIKSMDNFLGVVKRFEIDSEEYRPSTGEATMIVLDETLKSNYDVYILDEPEKSLGNPYVNDVLVSRINDLSKMKKTVIIVTHNANVAVRTFPFRSILKEYINGKYKTYVGNPYTNKLINIKDQNDTKNWKEESIKILEGGKEAFEERGEIYSE